MTKTIDYLIDGQPVSAAMTNRPLRQLSNLIGALQSVVDGITNRAALVSQSLPVSSGAVVGTPVAYDDALRQYVPAVFRYDANSPTLLTKLADVRGVIAYKRASNVADVITSGAMVLTVAQAAAVGLTSAGDYRLSTSPGMFTLTGDGPVVLYWDGRSTAYLVLQQPPAASAHSHYTIDLSVHHVEGGSGLPGWISVGDTGLPPGKPPVGAAYGYNLLADPRLQSVWPPAPADQAAMMVFPGGWLGYGQEIPPGTFLIDNTTIWWMIDAQGYRPWELVERLGGSSIAAPPGPGVAPPARLAVMFSRVRYGTTPVTVTSLTAADPDGPIKVSRCDGTPGSTGPLSISWLPAGEIAQTNAIGATVVKSLTAGKQSLGLVAEGLVAADDTIQLSGSIQRHLNPTDSSTPIVHQGVVTVRAIVEPADRTITPQLVSLQDTVQRPDLLTVAFLPGINSAVTYKFVLPGPSRFPVNPKATLKVWLTGAVSGVLPSIAANYTRMPVPTVPQPVPGTPTAMTAPTFPSVSSGYYVELDWGSIGVAAGDIVVITLSRAGSTDGYTGDVGILNVSLNVTAGP